GGRSAAGASASLTARLRASRWRGRRGGIVVGHAPAVVAAVALVDRDGTRADDLVFLPDEPGAPAHRALRHPPALRAVWHLGILAAPGRGLTSTRRRSRVTRGDASRARSA